MKKFMYGRLHSRENGYGYYIQPSGMAGKLHDHIVSEQLGTAEKWLFLQNDRGQVIFGVRERLNLTDESGRLRRNFMGFEVDISGSDGTLPYFDTLSAQFESITTEAYRVHDLLDQDPRCGDTLRDTDIYFEAGNFNPDNDWDRAVHSLYQNPTASFSFIFDASGFQKTLAQRTSRLQERLEKTGRGGAPEQKGVVRSGISREGTKGADKADSQMPEKLGVNVSQTDQFIDRIYPTLPNLGQEHPNQFNDAASEPSIDDQNTGGFLRRCSSYCRDMNQQFRNASQKFLKTVGITRDDRDLKP